MPVLDRRALRRAGWIVLAWTAMGLFFFSQDLTRKLLWRDPTPWWQSLLGWMTGVYLSAAFTPVILWLGRRFPLERERWRRAAALHLPFSFVFAVVHLALDSALLTPFGIYSRFTQGGGAAVTFFFLFPIAFHSNVVSYWTVLALQAAFHHYGQSQERRRQALRLELQASELQTHLVEARLSALKGQLQPHFLFNTLNSIMVLVRQGKAAQAEEMLARLSDLLRCALDDVEAAEVPLRRELELLEIYLSIEQVRFQDRLRVEIAAPPSVLDAAVPHLSLQPLVENAVRHGIGRRSAAGRLRIEAERAGGDLVVRVRDDGPGLPAEGVPRPEPRQEPRGIGLANTRARLRQLYGDAASLTLENGPAGGAVATLTVPYRIAEETAATTAAMTARTVTESLEIHAPLLADRR